MLGHIADPGIIFGQTVFPHRVSGALIDDPSQNFIFAIKRIACFDKLMLFFKNMISIDDLFTLYTIIGSVVSFNFFIYKIIVYSYSQRKC